MQRGENFRTQIRDNRPHCILSAYLASSSQCVYVIEIHLFLELQIIPPAHPELVEDFRSILETWVAFAVITSIVVFIIIVIIE